MADGPMHVIGTTCDIHRVEQNLSPRWKCMVNNGAIMSM